MSNGNGFASKGTVWGSIILQTIILLAAIVGVWAGIEKRLIVHDLAIGELRGKFDHDEKDERALDISRMTIHHNISSCNSLRSSCHRIEIGSLPLPVKP